MLAIIRVFKKNPKIKTFSVVFDKTPTHALFIQHYISLAC